MTPVEIVAAAAIVVGVFFTVVSAIGVLRLPDLYTRAHSTSKSETLGTGLCLLAVALTFGFDVSAVKTVLLIVFMFLTNPTAAHAIARAAADQGIEPWTADEAEGEE